MEFESPSSYGLVQVKDHGLSINGKNQCSFNRPGDTSQNIMAEYGVDGLEKKEGLEILNVGLGCGMTLESSLPYAKSVDVVEINPKVVLANRMFSDVLKDERVNLIVGDGLEYMRTTDKKYDLVLIVVQSPLVAHSTDFYTVEGFELVGRVLKEKGVYVLWSFSLGNKRYDDVLYYSMKEVFDNVYDYPHNLLATNNILDKKEHVPEWDYEVNTVDHKVLQNYWGGQ